MDNRYKKGKIYRITDVGYEKCYYGSTVESLSRRMSHHRGCYECYKGGNGKYISVYAIFDEYGIDNCRIELVEEFPCDSKEKLRRREGFFIQNNPCVNKYIPGRSVQEYINDNKETIAEQKLLYYRKNKTRILESNKSYREKNKGMIKITQQLYRDENKDYFSEKKKQHYEQNKDRINQKHVCDTCNGRYTTWHKSAHLKTRLHLEAMKQYIELE